MNCNAISSSLLSAINCLKEAITPCAFSFAFVSQPASIILSLLTASIICSFLFLISTNVFLRLGLSKGLQAVSTRSFVALSNWSMVGSSVLKSSLALLNCVSGSVASNSLFTSSFSDLPSETLLISFLSLSVVSLSNDASLPASEVRVSSSLLPSATDRISFSNETCRLRSNGRESVLSFSHTPMASTITKCVLSGASGVTALKSVLEIVRVPRPFICSK